MPNAARVREFLRHTIRFFFLIGISLFGIVYELLNSANVRWLLIGGYGFVIVISAYRIWDCAQQDGETDEND